MTIPPTVLTRDIVFQGYCNHVHTCTDSLGNVFAVATIARNGKFDSVVRRRQQGTGAWSDVFLFDEETYGKHGYGSCSVVGSHLVCLLSERQSDGTTQVREYIIVGVANTSA
jgi:hypothetical protein